MAKGPRTGIRVLHVIAGAKGGGAEGIMLDAVEALAEAGVRQHVVTRGHKARLAALDAAHVGFDLANFDKDSRDQTKDVIRTAAEKFSPDVIHYWMGRAASFAPKQWRERSLGWYGGAYDCDRFPNCAWHVGATDALLSHIVEQGVDEARAGVLHGYVKLEPAPATRRADFDTPEDAPVLLALSRLEWESGIDVLLDAMRRVKDAYAWIAGEGPMIDALKQQARKLDIEKRVRFVGSREDDAGLLAACDAVVSPARHDPFGLTALEAWAANRPLVAADAAGPCALVTDEVNALLVPHDDARALGEALTRVLEDGSLAKTLAGNGARRYHTHFTKTAFVRSAMTLYDRVRRGVDQAERMPAA